MYFSPSPNRLRPLKDINYLLGDVENVDESVKNHNLGGGGGLRRPILQLDKHPEMSPGPTTEHLRHAIR